MEAQLPPFSGINVGNQCSLRHSSRRGECARRAHARFLASRHPFACLGESHCRLGRTPCATSPLANHFQPSIRQCLALLRRDTHWRPSHDPAHRAPRLVRSGRCLPPRPELCRPIWRASFEVCCLAWGLIPVKEWGAASQADTAGGRGLRKGQPTGQQAAGCAGCSHRRSMSSNAAAG